MGMGAPQEGMGKEAPLPHRGTPLGSKERIGKEFLGSRRDRRY
eukprot:CAMPEP_0168617166 /NCGR_PEP_ID=MMETSP0449_2-20121227/5405_1 /TAXON_ID=1082188 /ORGANISM="Strombidium rassoulzadegani, Strain ras09" /LENGTH=42 /DNA_ID= /DNA_START= /DNA_END= /DNA_ORIENTATION=